MWYQIITFSMIIIVTKSSHVSKNDSNSDVIVTYAGHAEAIYPLKPIITEKPVTETVKTEKTVKLLIPESLATETPVTYEDTESVIFVPNEKPIFRNSDVQEEKVEIENVNKEKKTMNDILKSNVHILATEAPSEDIYFISGKNNENLEKPEEKYSANHDDDNDMSVKEKKHKKISLNCSNLNCNNTVNSVCGGKIKNRTWQYRLFLNECYYRKVNCDFKYDMNRYRVMPEEFCKPIGSQYSERPFVYNPPLPPLPAVPRTPTPVGFRKNFSSRRSLNIEVDGSFCSHPCPFSCPEEYSPECAVTSRGQRQVFVNHCKMDHNSCSYGTVWHKRPLSSCVGSKKADIRQNRAFIGWMQAIGIVDGKGRLVME